jgi:hypothetical protein
MILSLGRVISENETMKDEIEKTLVIFRSVFLKTTSGKS